MSNGSTTYGGCQMEIPLLPNSQLAIGINKSKPIGNRQLVDLMLEDYQDLIDPLYVKWFAKLFYDSTPDVIARCASEARADGHNPQRLFTFLVKKRLGKLK